MSITVTECCISVQLTFECLMSAFCGHCSAV